MIIAMRSAGRGGLVVPEPQSCIKPREYGFETGGTLSIPHPGPLPSPARTSGEGRGRALVSFGGGASYGFGLSMLSVASGESIFAFFRRVDITLSADSGEDQKSGGYGGAKEM